MSQIANFSTTDSQPVTTIISQKVKPGREQGYEEWVKGIIAAAQQFPGHQGVTVLRPQRQANPEYTIILRFDSYQNLEKWLNSELRQEWIERSHPLVEKPHEIQFFTGFETWFTLPDRPLQPPPARYKMAIITAICVFTLVNLCNWLLSGLLSGLPPLLRSLIVIVLVVISLTYLIMPQLTKLLRGWLFS
jgi:uncharacterized protein